MSVVRVTIERLVADRAAEPRAVASAVEAAIRQRVAPGDLKKLAGAPEAIAAAVSKAMRGGDR